ncbi:MAG TPA: FAD-dependent oxidoreductase, partial [Burkholderiales bacterium]|nr:FAD-dependent oxidoreductase [Burkholderiales bacterium]
FGAWIAHHLQRSGQSVVLLDAYGAGNSRASSGGESRIIRMGYGADEIYTRWAIRSLVLWQEFFRNIEEPLFHRTGVLWMAREEDPYSLNTLRTLERLGVRFEKLSRVELEKRYPQIDFGSVTWGIFEPDSGALMARRAVQRVVEHAIRIGTDYRVEAVEPPAGSRVNSLITRGGEHIDAASFVFACGAWLPKLFPDLLKDRIHPTRQEVFFFGVDPGDRRFAPPQMPTWIDFGDQVYGMPDLENRGFKVGPDRHGPALDPDTGERIVSAAGLATARRFLAQRFPALQDAPLVETRVCQYENTSSGDFLIDRHPAFDNVWLVGGGSGHGFKHGPAVGEYVASRILEGGAIEPRFALAAKGKVRKREVF